MEKTILIVDDEKEAHELIKLHLMNLNVKIYSAYNGAEGIRLYKELMISGKKPDLVIIDLNLSGSKKLRDVIKQIRGEKIDGVKTTKEILRMDANANIIGFTAYANLEWGKKLKEAGAKEVYWKKMGFEDFVKKIIQILM